MRKRINPALALLVALFVVGAAAGPGHAEPPVADRPGPIGPVATPASPPADPGTVVVRFRPGVAEAAATAVVARQGLSILGPVGSTGDVLVETRGKPAAEVAARLRSDPRVEGADLNHRRRAAVVPNDPCFTNAGNDPRCNGNQAYLANLGMPSAWDLSRGSNLTVAVLDTGVDLDHPEFLGRVLPGWDFVNNLPLAADDDGHGTRVAGVAAAGTDNGIGVAGTAWSARILPVKVLDANGEGTDDDVASGITWAVDNGAKVINVSLGGPDDGMALRDAVNYALARDVVMVAAAGNDSSGQGFYPAAYPGVVSVTATDAAGGFAAFSNYGPWTSVAAPGVGITSTSWITGPFEAYGKGSGTSFAAPIVSGIAVLLRSANPTWTQSQVGDQLRRTATDMGAAGFDPRYGYGWVNPSAALARPGPWGYQGGVLTSGPDAASSGEGRLDTFVRGPDNGLWQKTWTPNGWGGWVSQGGYLTSEPGVVSWGPNRLDVFVRGGDYALWHRAWDGISWSGWESLGGYLTSAPDAASWAGGRLDVVVRGGDNAGWHRAWNGSSWTAWAPLGGYLTSSPTAVSWSANRLDVFVGGPDNALWHLAWDGSSWSAWERLGGYLTSGPDAASRSPGRLDVVVRGGDNAVWQRSWEGSGWSAWTSLGGFATSDPTAVSRRGLGRLDVLVRSSDNALWHKA